MGTSSSIGIKQPSGQVRAISCHWDGYPEHVGRVLHEFYSNAGHRTSKSSAALSIPRTQAGQDPIIVHINSFPSWIL